MEAVLWSITSLRLKVELAVCSDHEKNHLTFLIPISLSLKLLGWKINSAFYNSKSVHFLEAQDFGTK